MSDLRRFQKYKEEIMKQKASIYWFKEGDKNTKFFHAHVKDKRKKLWIHNIEDGQVNVLTSDQKISREVVSIFQ